MPLAKYSLWDWAYHGAGAACITNWARAILAIKPENEEMVFRFIAAKRGKRIGDEWENCFEQYYSWSSIAGVLCWAKATADQIAKASGSKSKVKFADLAKVFECVPLLDPEIRTTVESNIRRKLELGKHTVHDAINQLLVDGRIFARVIPNPKPGNGRRAFSGLSISPAALNDSNFTCPESKRISAAATGPGRLRISPSSPKSIADFGNGSRKPRRRSELAPVARNHETPIAPIRGFVHETAARV